ncbi:DUF732 domain-containing protein [Mycolicibacterium sp. S2-37]|uniref:DUF732 domain-containing protein n=1 Tax=Mycolicibacterium sp. S2-37 TaxID=2810297 RepID=UPI001A94813B|nr:DUF732 domain-containing protein [Mycolicibacterium sp. S2-37]MBO0679636.1 DUF732 domain-containing protein [Mycolicibacterium sp. S2-37]
MKRTHRVAAASLVVSAGLSAAALSVAAAPAQADTAVDVFLSTLDGSGLVGIDQGTAARVGQQVCPMLAEPGQNLANVAADVSDSIGRPLGPATMFTGLAIQVFCPGAVSALAAGNSPIPLPGLGVPGLF